MYSIYLSTTFHSLHVTKVLPLSYIPLLWFLIFFSFPFFLLHSRLYRTINSLICSYLNPFFEFFTLINRLFNTLLFIISLLVFHVFSKATFTLNLVSIIIFPKLFTQSFNIYLCFLIFSVLSVFSLSNIRKNGEYPVDECSSVLYACVISFRYSCHLVFFTSDRNLNKDNRVLFIISVWPLPAGWYAVVLLWLTHTIMHTIITPLPTMIENCYLGPSLFFRYSELYIHSYNITFATIIADWFLVAMVYVNLVKISVTTRFEFLPMDDVSTVIKSIDTSSSGLLADNIPIITGPSLKPLILLHTVHPPISDIYIFPFPNSFIN